MAQRKRWPNTSAWARDNTMKILDVVIDSLLETAADRSNSQGIRYRAAMDALRLRVAQDQLREVGGDPENAPMDDAAMQHLFSTALNGKDD